LPPKLIRLQKASSVKMSSDLAKFLTQNKDEWLHGKVQNEFDKVKEDRFAGDKVPKDRIPRYYRKKWGVDNLYVDDLGPDWRFIYTIEFDGVGPGVVALDVLTHKEYDKRFGYRTT
jgi:hypothetical protein